VIVVVWAARDVPLPAGAKRLGETSAAAWLTAEHDAVMARPQGLFPLYLSRAAYDRDVRGLQGTDLAQAVLQRFTTWSLPLGSRALEELVRAKRPGLSLAARARAETYFETSLALMARLGRGGRYDALSDDERLDLAHALDGQELAELGSPEARGLPIADELALRRRFTDELAALLALRGRPDYRTHPRLVTPVRACFYAKATPAQLERWNDAGTPGIPWNGGLIGPRSSPQDPAPVVHAHWTQLSTMRHTLTRAQLDAQLGAVLAAKDLGMTALLADRRLEVALARRALLSSLKDAQARTVLGRQVADETRWWRGELAARPEATPDATLIDSERRAAMIAWFLGAMVAPGETSQALTAAGHTIQADLALLR
jgi:hypothetical protein